MNNNIIIILLVVLLIFLYFNFVKERFQGNSEDENSPEFSRQALAQVAKNLGITVTDEMSKDEIITEINKKRAADNPEKKQKETQETNTFPKCKFNPEVTSTWGSKKLDSLGDELVLKSIPSIL